MPKCVCVCARVRACVHEYMYKYTCTHTRVCMHEYVRVYEHVPALCMCVRQLHLHVHGGTFSYRFHKIGLLVLFLQDIGDIVLELGKTSFYFKERRGKSHAIPEYFANFFFAVFTMQQ